jgi:hypothetical protein
MLSKVAIGEMGVNVVNPDSDPEITSARAGVTKFPRPASANNDTKSERFIFRFSLDSSDFISQPRLRGGVGFSKYLYR